MKMGEDSSSVGPGLESGGTAGNGSGPIRAKGTAMIAQFSPVCASDFDSAVFAI